MLHAFDVEKINTCLEKFNILGSGVPNKILDFEELFLVGTRAQAKVKVGADISTCLPIQILLASRAAPHLCNISSNIVDWLGDGVLAVQLRIENGWKKYLKSRMEKRGGEDILIGEEKTVDADRIFSKIAATSELSKFKKILACCDEADLDESKIYLKKLASKYDLDLIFKSDFSDKIIIPESRFQQSLIDFEVVMSLDAYVGLTRSTFSNNLCTLKSLEENKWQPANHFIYNAIGESCLKRHDFGLFSDPGRAIFVS